MRRKGRSRLLALGMAAIVACCSVPARAEAAPGSEPVDFSAVGYSEGADSGFAAFAATTPFFDHPLLVESTARELTSKYNRGDAFVVYGYRTGCSNSRARTTVLSKWMTKYNLTVHSLNADSEGFPRFMWNLNGGGTSGALPFITFVGENECITFTARDSLQTIQRYLEDYLGITDDTSLDFSAFNRETTDAYKADEATLALHLQPESQIQTENAEIKARALKITMEAGAESDYEKLEAIHDWVAGNVRYDWPMYYGTGTGGTDALFTMRYQRSVCAGYANLTAALCRAAGIPTKVVRGFAAGVDTDASYDAVMAAYDAYMAGGSRENFTAIAQGYRNHAWNEAYVDGRWVILDTTWDSNNDYLKAGIGEEGGFLILNPPSSTYFDPDIGIFSEKHLFWSTGNAAPGKEEPSQPTGPIDPSMPGRPDQPAPGDLTGDGAIDARDVRLLKQAVARIAVLTPEQQRAADVTGDGIFDARDARKLSQYVARMIPSL